MNILVICQGPAHGDERPSIGRRIARDWGAFNVMTITKSTTP